MSMPRGHLSRIRIFRTPLSLLPLRWLLFLVLFSFCARGVAANNFDQDTPDSWPSHDITRQFTEDLALDNHLEATSYEAHFHGVGRDIIGRASEPVPTGLTDNAKANLDIKPGDIDYYSFAVSTSTNSARASIPTDFAQPDLKPRQNSGDNQAFTWTLSENEPTLSNDTLSPRQASNGETVWISMNTCMQPSFTSSEDRANPPQLSIYVSTSEKNPGPGKSNVQSFDLEEGFVSLMVETTTSVFIGVSAPNSSISGQNLWNYDLAASSDAPYHSFVDDSGIGLYLIDSDPHAALLVTSNLTGWMEVMEPQVSDINSYLDAGPQFGLFVSNTNDTDFIGLSRSYCALQSSQLYLYNDSTSSSGAEMGITYSQPPNGKPEQQFYVPSLNKTSLYYGHLSQMNATHKYGDSVVGGGGALYPRMNFTTKRDENCAVIYNLSFCSDVAYAVPANPYNPKVANVSDLAAVYDNYASAMWKNFTYSLMMTACDTTPSAQYSLVAGCDNCTTAYKTWLCAVTIPRCEDFLMGPSDNSTLDNGFGTSYLMPRNVAQQPIPNSVVPPITNSTQLDWVATNSSRNNATIAGLIQPGPYMEVLPCEDLCFNLTRMCPASLSFACPRPGTMLMAASYGQRGIAQGGGGTCSAPGILYFYNGAVKLSVIATPIWILSLFTVAFLIL